MKHALRKYITPCGSALFMVVSTMAALIVLVTAMYMSVLSSRQVQYATFDQEQAYVTSTSIGDMVYSTIPKNAALQSAISGLKNKGDSISTNGNGFSAFGGTQDDDQRLGAFDATITYVYDLESQKIYDLAVTVENNGVYETSHTFIKVSPGKTPDMRRISNFFTSTGYLPTDIWIKKVVTDSEVYFDNEYVKMTYHDLGSAADDMIYNYSLTALGTVDIDLNGSNKAIKGTLEKPLTWTIGVDLNYTPQNNNIDMGGNSSKDTGKMYIGRDFTYGGSNTKTIAQYTDVYVMRDCYLNSRTTLNGNLYIDGNLIIPVGQNPNDYGVVVNGELKVNGSIIHPDGTPVTRAGVIAGDHWDPVNKNWDVSLAKDFMNAKLTPSAWPAWTVNSVDDNIDIRFTSANNNTVYIDKDGTLGAWSQEQDSQNHFIIIDTGKEITDVRNLTISANNNDKHDGGEAFSWDPWNAYKTTVLTVGKGTLVLNVPDDVIYQDKSELFFGNIAWYTLRGGKVTVGGDGNLEFSRGDKWGETAGKLVDIINDNKLIVQKSELKAANESGACEYELVTTTIKVNGKDQERKYYTCKTHGGWYDTAREDDSCTEIDDYIAGNGESLCAGRINHKAFDKYYSSPEGSGAYDNVKKFYKNYGGYASSWEDYIYPNVNIYIASDSENARINFGESDYSNGEVVRGMYFGYVYAPYMTFYVKSHGGENGTVRSIGGLVVSDIVLAVGAEFLFAQPDRSILGLMDKNWQEAGSWADKSWRLSYGLT